ncbi:universal stress protein [Streptomyces sp. NPDC102274]|uniref:universal stress protein n=1 Tax=Streptomyces sp. NPDC102274 TaxID=3366151 RepID=UPI0038051719
MDGTGGRRVVVGVSGTPGSLTALHRAAAEARRADGELWAVLAWAPPSGGLGHRGPSVSSMLVECRRLAVERLLRTLDEAFGTAGPGVPLECLAVRSTPGAALVETACDPDDLLVVGAGVRGRLRRALWPSVPRYVVAHACCPVLAVPPSPLQDGLDAIQRSITRRMPLDTRELADD